MGVAPFYVGQDREAFATSGRGALPMAASNDRGRPSRPTLALPPAEVRHAAERGPAWLQGVWDLLGPRTVQLRAGT